MKKVILSLFFIAAANSLFGQSILSSRPVYNNEKKIKATQKKIDKIKNKINEAPTEETRKLSELENIKNDYEEGNYKSLMVESGINIDVSSNPAGSILKPKIFLNFKDNILNNICTSMILDYTAELKLNAPNNGDDEKKILESIIKTGADGELNAAIMWGYKIVNPKDSSKEKFRFTIAANNKLNWILSKEVSTEAFGYFTPGINIEITAHPITLIFHREWNVVNEDIANSLGTDLKRSRVTSLLVGVGLEDYKYIFSIKYIIESSKTIQNNINIGLGVGLGL